jgi:branched-chain amino acid transport system substrate-binding protein
MRVLKHLAVAGAIAFAAMPAYAEPGVTDNSITIGMSAPFSGPNGAYGQDMKQTIQAYFDQLNKGGGINGRKLELVALDDGYETERTVANTKALIGEKNAFALLSYYGSSPTTEAMNKVFGPAKVPLVGTISGAATLREPVTGNPNSRYMFNVRASYADETEAIVNQLVSFGLKNIAVFYQNDGFGQSGLDGVTAALKKHNLAPTAVGTVERNSLDVSKAVETIAKANPQAVVMVTLYKPTAAFVLAMKKAGQNPMFMTLSPVGTEQLAQELGAASRGIGVSQVVPYPWNDTLPVVREYQKLVAKSGQPILLRHGSLPDGEDPGRRTASRRQGPFPGKAAERAGRHEPRRSRRLSHQLLDQRPPRIAFRRTDGDRLRWPRFALNVRESQ